MSAAVQIQKRRQRTFAQRLRTRRSLAALVVGLLVIAALWQMVAMMYARALENPHYVMPDLGYAITVSLPQISDFYSGVFGGTPPGSGGSRSPGMGLLALVEHSAVSLCRVAAGLALGTLIGVVAGMLMQSIRPLREAFLGISNFFRMMPLLAMGPLFTLWLGATDLASIVFVTFAVAPIMLIATLGAIRDLDTDHINYARTLGATPAEVRRRIILPAIVPGIIGPLNVAAVLAWSVLLSSELWGIQNGIGWMMGRSLQFSQMGSVLIIALGFIVLTFATVQALAALSRRLTRWAE